MLQQRHRCVRWASEAFVVVFQLSHENVYEVLCVADMYLLPGLKRLCGRTLAALLNEENVLHVWKTAKLFRLSRLEDQCTEYMAKIIERVCHGQQPCVQSQLSCVYVSQNSHYLHSSWMSLVLLWTTRAF